VAVERTCFRAARRLTLLLAPVLVTAPVAETDNSRASKPAVPPTQARELLPISDGVLARPATVRQWSPQVRVERFQPLSSRKRSLWHGRKRSG
jgi:hypothetical protein